MTEVTDGALGAHSFDEILPSAAHRELLTALIDTIVPSDDYPSASEAGGLEFLLGLFGSGEKSDSRPRLVRVLDLVASTSPVASIFADLPTDKRVAVLDALEADDDFRWFESLVVHGYYADPDNGGNRDGASWRMLDYDPRPAGGWPRTPVTTPAPGGLVTPEGLLAHYDAIVVGSGAGGGVVACLLAEAGRSVLIIERGAWPDAQYLWRDQLRNPRAAIGFSSLAGPPSPGNPRSFLSSDSSRVIWPEDDRWGIGAMTAGGGTRVYGAQAWRFTREDFAMASRYGIPDGSAMADWPIGYDEMEPYYLRAEWEIGVSGTAKGDTWAGPRSGDYPMPPLPRTRSGRVLEGGAKTLGISTLPVPLLINSRSHNGRGACAQCSACVGFACPVDAKNGSQNTVIERALATGRCSILLTTMVERVTTDARGRVTGVAIVGDADGTLWRREVASAEVVVSAGAVESARLLLNSRSDREPNGLGNNADLVGRHLQGHLYTGAVGIFADEIVDDAGPGPSIATCDFRHGNPGIIGGGNLANEFVPTPVSVFQYLSGAGLIPRHGLESKQAMRRLRKRMVRVMGPIQEVTTADSRVRVDPKLRDRFGIPVAELSGDLHEEDIRAHAFMGGKSVEWLEASGAERAVQYARKTKTAGPSAGSHQAGTCRMGDDPAVSVTDPWGRVWGHDNLRVVDGSLHVTNGGANPVLTIYANAFRIADQMVSNPDR